MAEEKMRKNKNTKELFRKLNTESTNALDAFHNKKFNDFLKNSNKSIEILGKLHKDKYYSRLKQRFVHKVISQIGKKLKEHFKSYKGYN